MNDKTTIQRAHIMLCRVEGSINVGAICRAMKTMDHTRLVLTSCPAYDEAEIKTHAVHAFDIYEAALRFDTLGEAVKSYSYVAGFTRRRGRKRKEPVGVDSFAAALADKGAAAFVFGNERDGLSDTELALCDESVYIPASDDFPSINISHAVQIACWESFKQRPLFCAARKQTADRHELDDTASRCVRAMQAAGLCKLAGAAETHAFIRSVAARAALSKTELENFARLFIRFAGCGKQSDP